MEGRRLECKSANLTAVANNGFIEHTFNFTKPFNNIPYAFPSLTCYSDASKMGVIIKTISRTACIVRVGNSLNTDVPVTVGLLVIGI